MTGKSNFLRNKDPCHLLRTTHAQVVQGDRAPGQEIGGGRGGEKCKHGGGEGDGSPGDHGQVGSHVGGCGEQKGG